MILNYMASLVDSALTKELSVNRQRYTGLCQCPSCLAFVAAHALNQLTPFYVTCVAGQVFGEYRNKEKQYQSDILVAVLKGLDTAMHFNLHA